MVYIIHNNVRLLRPFPFLPRRSVRFSFRAPTLTRSEISRASSADDVGVFARHRDVRRRATRVVPTRTYLLRTACATVSRYTQLQVPT